MSWPRFLPPARWAGAAVGGAILAAAVATAADRPPNVVVIVADDLRPDALACLGNSSVATPALDALAARGAVFTRATCGYPICHVARSEMLAGRTLLPAYGVKPVGGSLAFPAAWVLWPEHLRRAGWRTVVSGKWHVAGKPARAGFEETSGLFSSGGAPAGMTASVPVTPTGRKVTGYVGWTFKSADGQPQPEQGVGLTPNTDRIIADGAIAAIQRPAEGPLFLLVNFTAPHDPLHWPAGRDNARRPEAMALPANFAPAPEFETGNTQGRDERVVPAPRREDDVRRERALYFTLVENLDDQVGRIVDALTATGQLARTLIVFTSDHGLALGSHGLMGKQNQYEHTLNVPLIMAGPGVPAQGQRFRAQCYLRDLYPTVCDLVGCAPPATATGRSLAPVLSGSAAEVYDEIFGYFTDTQRMVRGSDGWKLIWYPAIQRTQLFQVNDDPEERHDRSAEPAQATRLARLRATLAGWQRANADAAPLATTAEARP